MNALTVISPLIAVTASLLWLASYRYRPTAFWGADGTRFDVFFEPGALIVQRLDEYRFTTELHYGVLRQTTSEEWADFKTTPWWHGDNSAWEGIEYRVQSRTRFVGFEIASGTYWPPFVWQHPTVPFTMLRIPLWAVVALAGVLPAARLIRRIRSRSAGKADDGDPA